MMIATEGEMLLMSAATVIVTVEEALTVTQTGTVALTAMIVVGATMVDQTLTTAGDSFKESSVSPINAGDQSTTIL